MLDRPRLRAVEIFPVQQEGKTLVYLKDPQNFAQPLGISPSGCFIVSHFDGKHSLVDIQEAYSNQFGTLLLTHELTAFIDLLDNHLISTRIDLCCIETEWLQSLKPNPRGLPLMREASITTILMS